MHCTELRTEGPTCWSNSWSNMVCRLTPGPKPGLRHSISPWAKTALAPCRFRTTARWLCCEAWVVLKGNGSKEHVNENSAAFEYSRRARGLRDFGACIRAKEPVPVGRLPG